jgi:hypothetical protein
MALWEAPMTPTVTRELEGMILARRGGFSAGSSPISSKLETGNGPVDGEDPVHKTNKFEATVFEFSPFLGSKPTSHLFDCDGY